jgi:signal transduction histidine kinase
VKRLLGLSDRLELAARLDQPLELTLQPVDLTRLTRETLESFVPGNLRRRVEVVTAFPSEGATMLADATLLPRLLLELLSNANRFARRLLRVEVTLGESAMVRVEDDGEGVKEDEQALLFEPFAERRSHTGLGMGLWLAKRLAELHRGTLIVERLPVGTRQQLTLPISA